MTYDLGNRIVQWNGQKWRILHMMKERSALYSINAKDGALAITVADGDEFRRAVNEGTIVSLEDEFEHLRGLSPEDSGNSSSKKAQKLYDLIKPLVDDTRILYEPEYRRQQINALAAEQTSLTGGKTASIRKQIVRTLCTWWKKGQTPGALMPEYGSPGRHNCTKTPGRKPSDSVKKTAGTIPVNDRVRAIFHRYCERYILKEDGVSIDDAYSRLVAAWEKEYTPPVKDAEGNILKPTPAQFKYYYRSEFSSYERTRRKNKSQTWKKDLRPLTGNVYDITGTIGRIYEIDSTVADINLVSDEDPTCIIGRPTLYMVRDVFSGMIAGFHVSFNPACAVSAADALYCSIVPKTEFCAKFGVKLNEDDWPVHGIPRAVAADNGELCGSALDPFRYAFHVDLINTAPYRGDMKGSVEELFQRLQSIVNMGIPGQVDNKKLKKEGHKDTRAEARMTLREYIRRLINAIMIENSGFRTNGRPNGLPSNIACTRKEIWNWAGSTGRSSLRTAGKLMNVRRTLLPHVEASVSEDGLTWKKITWTCSDAAKQGWFNRGGTATHPKKAMLVYDPAVIDSCWLVENADTAHPVYHECMLAPCSRYLSGKSLSQAQKFIEVCTETQKEAYRHYCEQKGALLNETDSNAKEIASRAPAADGSNKKAAVAAMAQNRITERNRMEQENPRVQNEHSANGSISTGAAAANGSNSSGTAAVKGTTTTDYSFPENPDDIPD